MPQILCKLIMTSPQSSLCPAESGSRPIGHGRLPATLLVLLSSLLFLGGCSSLKNTFDFLPFVGDEVIEQDSVNSLTQSGMAAYQAGDYYDALENFNKILEQYPFSPQAMLAELKAADCHFYREEYAEAKSLYKEFEERHPSNEAVPYVIFQIGMCDFKRTDRIDRDTSGAREAIQSFSRLLRAYPGSPYAEEAKARIKVCRDFLVNHDYFVAVFYVRTKEYEQAKHRLKYIAATYPKSSIAPQAKALLARLEAGNPPTWGLRRWLPSLHMPNLKFWGPTDEKKAKVK